MIYLVLILLGLVLTGYIVIRRQRQALVEAELRRVRELEEQKERQETLQRSERARVEAMLDAMIEGLVVIDADRHIVLANRAAEAMFGFSRMMAGGTLLEAIRHHEVATLARRAAAESAPIEHEVRLERPEPRILQGRD